MSIVCKKKKSKQDVVSAGRDCTIGKSEALNDLTCIYAWKLTSLLTNQRGIPTKQNIYMKELLLL